MERDAGGLGPAGDQLGPLVGDDPAELAGQVVGYRLQYQRRQAVRRGGAVGQRKAQPALAGHVRYLGDREVQALAGVERLGLAQRAGEAGQPQAYPLHAQQPGVRDERVAGPQRVRVSERGGEVGGVARGEPGQCEEPGPEDRTEAGQDRVPPSRVVGRAGGWRGEPPVEFG